MRGLDIKEKRKKIGLTQKELAEKIGVTRKTINSYENGSPIPIYIIKLFDSLLNDSSDENVTKSNINSTTTGVAINAGATDQIKEFADILKTAQDQQTKLLDQLSESQRHLSTSQEQVNKLIEMISEKLR